MGALSYQESKLLVCRDVSELTTEYLDDSLPWRKRMGMRFHLAICSFCRRHLAQVRATIGLLGRLPPVPVSQVTEDRLLAQLRVPPETPPAPF
jgi:anti-sigma factor RsiW